jgi:hypothetical protein
MYIATLYLGTESKSTTSLLELISSPQSFCTSSLRERLRLFVVLGVSGLSELSAYDVSREKRGDAKGGISSQPSILGFRRDRYLPVRMPDRPNFEGSSHGTIWRYILGADHMHCDGCTLFCGSTWASPVPSSPVAILANLRLLFSRM